MSGRRLMDSLDGVSTYFEHDSKAGQNIFTHIQDVEPFVDWNKHAAPHLDKKEDYWFVGRIPDTVILQWAAECGAKPYSKTWQAYAAKQLNKAEYAKLNPNRIQLDTREGRG